MVIKSGSFTLSKSPFKNSFKNHHTCTSIYYLIVYLYTEPRKAIEFVSECY